MKCVNTCGRLKKNDNRISLFAEVRYRLIDPVENLVSSGVFYSQLHMFLVCLFAVAKFFKQSTNQILAYSKSPEF